MLEVKLRSFPLTTLRLFPQATACLLGLTAWWSLLFALGFPQPNYDDLFFAGPAISLATGEGLVNPWIQTWLLPFGTESFLVQPPFHAYLLGAWLQVCGIGDQSLRLFCIIGAWISALGLVALSRRAGLSWCLALAVALLGSSWPMGFGLRPDGTGVLFCTIAALGWTGRNTTSWVVGSLFGAAAPLIHPFTATIIVPLAVWRLLATAHDEADLLDWQRLGVRAVIMLLACGAVFALFLLAIDGQLHEFARVFGEHAARRLEYADGRWAYLVSLMMIGWEPVLRWPTLIMLAVGLLLAARGAATRRRTQVVGLLFAGFVFLGGMIYAGHLVRVLYLCALIATAFLSPALHGRTRLFFGIGWLIAALLLLCTSAIQSVFIQRPAIDAPALQLRLAGILAAPGRRLLLDEYAARYVYDWHLPPHAEDWLHAHRPTAHDSATFSLTDKDARDVWIVDAAKLEQHVADSGVTTERIRLGGYQTSMRRRLGELRIVP